MYSYLFGFVSGFVISQYYHNDKKKYDNYIMIGMSIIKGITLSIYRKIKRKVANPDLMGMSGVLLRSGSEVEWSENTFNKSPRLTSQEIVNKMNFGDGKATFILDIIDEDDKIWRVWATGMIMFERPLWPFNQIVSEEREAITEAAVEIRGKNNKVYIVTSNFKQIDGPQNNFGGNCNVPVWVAVKLILPAIDCIELQQSEIQVGTIHGSVMVTGMDTLYHLHEELVQMEENLNLSDEEW